MKAKVYLIGAGPQDPELISLKGIKCIKKSDVIIYDYLANLEFLNYAKEGAKIEYVGKKSSNHTKTQDEINELIIKYAKENLTVARLKGGDPFIFGRGGEEACVLADHNIDFEIIPGITSAISVPAYAGIPLTHRDFNTSVSFITGHEDPNKKESSIKWEHLSKSGSSLVFLMGMKNLKNIVKNLIDNGKSKDTKVAIIRWGTSAKQKTVVGTLETIVQVAKENNMKAPAIIVVGEVVSLRDKLSWFEKKELFGKRILVTRARSQASILTEKLKNLGANCFEFPTIEIKKEKDLSLLQSAIKNLSAYKWLIFTSVNGVKFFFEELFDSNKDARDLHGIKICAIGPATCKEIEKHSLRVDIVPKTYRAESIIEAFSDINLKDEKILLPRAKNARLILPCELEKMGAKVDEIIIYEAHQVNEKKDELIKLLKDKEIDLISFTSSSTVSNFAALLPQDKDEQKELLSQIKIACIGPITSDTASEFGFKIDVVADEYTIDGLVEAIRNTYL